MSRVIGGKRDKYGGEAILQRVHRDTAKESERRRRTHYEPRKPAHR
jgi:hypothetical protein